MASLRKVPFHLHAMAWFAFLFVLLSFAGVKTAENNRDRDRLIQWSEESKSLEAESFREKDRLVSLVRSVHSKINSREILEKELNQREPFEFQKQGTMDVVHWTHPKYGILVELKFEGSMLTSSLVRYGTAQLLSVMPQPDMISRHSRLEYIRNVLAELAWPLWLAVFVISAIFLPRKAFVAEGAVAASLAYLVLLAVSPWYSLTFHGLLSNDRLGIAVVPFLLSCALLCRHGIFARSDPALILCVRNERRAEC